MTAEERRRRHRESGTRRKILRMLMQDFECSHRRRGRHQAARRWRAVPGRACAAARQPRKTHTQHCLRVRPLEAAPPWGRLEGLSGQNIPNLMRHSQRSWVGPEVHCRTRELTPLLAAVPCMVCAAAASCSIRALRTRRSHELCPPRTILILFSFAVFPRIPSLQLSTPCAGTAVGTERTAAL